MTLANIAFRTYLGGVDIRFTLKMKMPDTQHSAVVRDTATRQKSIWRPNVVSRTQGLSPSKSWFRANPLNQSKNGRYHLGNARGGNGDGESRVALFTMSSYSDHVILVPPDKNLLLHVSSDRFREWDESAGMGKPMFLPSGNRLTLDVQLEPSE